MNNGIWNKERGPIGVTGDTGPIGPDGPVFDGSTPLDELTVNGLTELNSGTANTTLALTSSDASCSLIMSDDTTTLVSTLVKTGNALSINGSGGNVLIKSFTDNGDLLQVGSNTNSSASLGRVALYGTNFNAYLSHYAYKGSETNYSIRMESDGDLRLNAITGKAVSITNNNSIVATFSGTDISLLKPVTISDFLSVDYSSVGGTVAQFINNDSNGYGILVKLPNNTTGGQYILEARVGSSTTRFKVAADGNVFMPGLPTSNPNSAGALWNSSGTVMISAG
jgi:hypothetical protein